MVSFVELPVELIQHTISFLAANEGPCKQYLHEEPSVELILSTDQSLKSLSQVCRYLHGLCFPYLYSKLRAHVDDLADFIEFIDTHDLSAKLQSLVLFSMESYGGATNSLSSGRKAATTYNTLNWSQIVSILDILNPKVLTFVIPPMMYQCLVGYQLKLKDAWAFDISHQILRLEQKHDDALTKPVEPETNPNIFTARPWSHVTFNEGSAIPAYSSYEYFHKDTPSLLVPDISDLIMDFSATLTSFDLIAVFPIGHMGAVCSVLYDMKHLRRLRIQLAPSLANDVLDDSKRMGRSQRPDLWNELEKSYRNLTCRMRDSSTGEAFVQLQEFITLDYANAGLREVLDRCIALGSWGWQHDGNGKWILPERMESSIAGHAG